MILCLSFAATSKRTSPALMQCINGRCVAISLSLQCKYHTFSFWCNANHPLLQCKSKIHNKLEEAVRWFYINRGTIAGHIDSNKGWSYTAPRSKIRYSVPSDAVGYQNAVELLSLMTERLSRVQIHDWDFEKAILKYQSHRTLLYVDEPYRGKEHYYQVDRTPAFSREDHKRLARLLNETPSMAVVSHYDVPELEEDYPVSRWRRVYISSKKELSRLNATLQDTCEVLLCNYEATEPFPLFRSLS